MYDILKNIWKTPTPTFSPMPIWIWDKTPDHDEITRQINEMHKKGVDGFILKYEAASPKYLSDEYFALVQTAAEAAAKRHMLFSLHAEIGSDLIADTESRAVNQKLTERVLYALDISEEIPEGEDILYRVWIKFDEEGRVTESSLDDRSADGFEGYNLVLGYGDERSADILNPAAAENFIENVHARHHAKLGEFFAATIVGFFTPQPSLIGFGSKIDKKISWSYGTLGEFFEAEGEIEDLVYLLFPTKTPKQKKEAEYKYRCALRSVLGQSFYKPMSDWCRTHGIALMGYPAEEGDVSAMKHFDIPGQSVSKDTRGIAASSVVKCAADIARHNGIARCSAKIFDGESDITTDELIHTLNSLFVGGCNMIIPCSFRYSSENADLGMNSEWWKDYRKISSYIKRMAWLNSMGSNNPDVCVLCSDEHLPRVSVESLYKKGYTFNYLTFDDLISRAKCGDGKISIDRYNYEAALIDPRLRLTSEHVIKLGHFVTSGGLMYRGNAFGVFMEKNAKKKSSYFEGEGLEDLRFTHITKSGCTFFVMINEGESDIDGYFVTDISCAAEEFDAVSGNVYSLTCEMRDSGFAYKMRIPSHSAKVIGMDSKTLPKIAKGDADDSSLLEIRSIGSCGAEIDHTCMYADRVILSAVSVKGAASVKIGGEEVGRMLFKPYEIDITEHLKDGKNLIEFDGAEGVTLRMYKKK